MKFKGKIWCYLRFFNTRHPGAYKLYNLCSEKKYKHSYFEGRVSEFDIDDHNPPEDFLLIHRFCQDMVIFKEFGYSI